MRGDKEVSSVVAKSRRCSDKPGLQAFLEEDGQESLASGRCIVKSLNHTPLEDGASRQSVYDRSDRVVTQVFEGQH